MNLMIEMKQKSASSLPRIALLIALGIAMAFTSADADAQRRPVKRKARPVAKAKVVHPRTPQARKRRAVYRYYTSLPRRHAVVTTTPNGAVVIKHSTTRYRFHRGIWYRPANNGFRVVMAPRGARIRVLPAGHRRIVVGPATYFYYYGAFYRKVDNSDEYEVVEAPEGAVVDELPDGGQMEIVDGVEYYVVDETYFRAVVNDEGKTTGYEVTRL